jgi:protein phosphatase
MIFYGKTDVGKKRSENQDCFGYKKLDNGMILLAVCDGMGGANGGQIASTLALDAFLSFCESELPHAQDTHSIKSVLASAVHKANSDVFNTASKNEDLRGMGSTLAAALICQSSGELYIVNIGDSRIYAISSLECNQLSHDHSYVQYLVDIGELTPEKARTHPKKNLITKAIGVEESVNADIDKISDTEICRAENESVYLLLCSDGLTGMVNDEDIQSILISDSDRSVAEKVDSLVSLANEHGGNDNITVIVHKI